jgi:hypothetical protein
MNKNNKKLEFLLISLNILFVIYYIVLAVFSRPHYDDLHFLWKMREMSIYEYVMDMYYSRSGRFIAYAINGVIFKTINGMNAHWFFPVLFWGIGVALTIYGICKMASIKVNFVIVNVVVLFYNLFVLSNIDFAVFNWLCAMSYYILAPAMLALLALVLSAKNSIIQYGAIIALSIFLGGAQEAFTPIVLAVLFFMFMYILKQNKWNVLDTLHAKSVQKIIVSGLILLAILVVVVVAPGNYKRLGADEFATPTTLNGYVKGFVNAISMFVYYISFYIPYYLVVALLAYKLLANKLNLKLIIRKEYFVLSVSIYAIFLLLSVFPSVYLWGGFGIQRNYTTLVFVTMFFIVYWTQYLITFIHQKNEHVINISTYIAACTLLCIMLVNVYFDTKSARQYASDVDSRIEFAQRHQQSGSIANLVVPPLSIPYTIDVKYVLFNLIGKKSNPRPVLYYISDTNDVPNEYALHFRKYYQLDFDIVLQKVD